MIHLHLYSKFSLWLYTPISAIRYYYSHVEAVVHMLLQSRTPGLIPPGRCLLPPVPSPHRPRTEPGAPVAKSNIIMEVKPWDDETDMAEVERLVRTIQQDGLVWGSSKLVPVGYGIQKLQICCVVEDDKVR